MGINLNADLNALNVYRGLEKAGKTVTKSLERLSSGVRLNSAKDDAAGLAITQQLIEVVRGLNTAMGNVQDGYNLLNTADGGLEEAQSILQNMRELSVQAANGTLTDDDRAALQAEMEADIQQLNSLASGTQFNGQSLLDGTRASVDVQTGAEAGQTAELNLSSVRATDLGVNSIDITTQAGATASIAGLEIALSTISEQRDEIGALQNRMESTIADIGVAWENILAAESRIMDADLAVETMNLAKGQILQKAGISALAQGNMSAEKVLSLIG